MKRWSRWSRWLLIGALVGCAAEDEVVALELTADATCSADRLAALASVSVEVYGDADGELCTLARRCVTLAEVATVDELTAALRAATQPLVDTELADSRQNAVLGHDRLGCGEGDRMLCGFVDVAEVTDAGLTVPLRCEAADCPPDVPPFCP
jgi:hypothetical protein